MNNAKMWLVVPPAVGVPVFLGAVAVASFAVHVAVVTNTSWVSDYLSGQPLGSGDMAAAVIVDESAALGTQGGSAPATASYAVPGAQGEQQVLVIMPDGTTRAALLQAETLAAATPPPSSH